MLLVGRQEGYPTCKKTEWWGAGARCRLAYVPADATSTHSRLNLCVCMCVYCIFLLHLLPVIFADSLLTRNCCLFTGADQATPPSTSNGYLPQSWAGCVLGCTRRHHLHSAARSLLQCVCNPVIVNELVRP